MASEWPVASRHGLQDEDEDDEDDLSPLEVESNETRPTFGCKGRREQSVSFSTIS